MPALVQRLRGVPGANAYLVTSAEGLVLVDCGFGGSAPAIEAALRALGHDPRALAVIALTHADPDHAGGAAELRALTGVRVAVHAHDAPLLAGGLTPRSAKGPWRRDAALSRLARLGHELGMAAMVRLPGRRWRRCEADLLLADRDRLPGLTVLHVPGHTAGSVAFATDDGEVLVGDAVFGDAAGRAHHPPRALALDPAASRRSALSLMTGGHTVLYPGHGLPVRPGPGGAATRALEPGKTAAS